MCPLASRWSWNRAEDGYVYIYIHRKPWWHVWFETGSTMWKIRHNVQSHVMWIIGINNVKRHTQQCAIAASANVKLWLEKKRNFSFQQCETDKMWKCLNEDINRREKYIEICLLDKTWITLGREHNGFDEPFCQSVWCRKSNSKSILLLTARSLPAVIQGFCLVYLRALNLYMFEQWKTQWKCTPFFLAWNMLVNFNIGLCSQFRQRAPTPDQLPQYGSWRSQCLFPLDRQPSLTDKDPQQGTHARSDRLIPARKPRHKISSQEDKEEAVYPTCGRCTGFTSYSEHRQQLYVS